MHSQNLSSTYPLVFCDFLAILSVDVEGKESIVIWSSISWVAFNDFFIFNT